MGRPPQACERSDALPHPASARPWRNPADSAVFFDIVKRTWDRTSGERSARCGRPLANGRRIPVPPAAWRGALFRGLSAAASLKPCPPPASRTSSSPRSLPRPQCRGLIEARPVSRSAFSVRSLLFRGLSAAASLKRALGRVGRRLAGSPLPRPQCRGPPEGERCIVTHSSAASVPRPH